MKCQSPVGVCEREAKWKVPLYAEPSPHCLCDEHVKEWRVAQPQNVKAIDDDTPWSNPKTGFHRESRVTRR
jgi:hypothetical protein